MTDTATPYGQRVARRLEEETIAWLTTVSADGTPLPSPIWFLWDGTEALIYSKPDQPKLRNIARSRRVAFHFDGDGQGGNIVVFRGDARVDPTAPPADQVSAYLAKYRTAIDRIGMTPASFSREYSVAIWVALGRPRGH